MKTIAGILLPTWISSPRRSARVDRRTFMMRSAVIGSAAVITGARNG